MQNDASRAALGAPNTLSRRRLLVMAASIGLLTACGGPASPAAKSPNEQAAQKPADAKPAEAAKPAASPAAASAAKPVGKTYASPPPMSIDPNKAYTAVIKTSLGEMTAELYAKDAPNTVNNFVFLSKEGFYNGVIFHRIIKDFMVQTGDPTGTGRGDPGYKFGDELKGPQTYTKGTLAMANAGPNTQGSQFFICHGPGAERLPKNYSIFGKVTGGIDVLDKIAGVQVRPGPGGENSQPVDPPKIDTIQISEG
jgi:cyclophilin family peptidyl-prolyl cis-trans isomerase